MYASEKYFKNKFKGKYSGDDLQTWLKWAADVVDILTLNRIKAKGFAELTKFQQKSIRDACCLIVEHTASGDGPNTDIDSFWMQDMRINMRRRKQRPWEAAGIGMWAWLKLQQTGLMRGYAA